jgi:hypothetical protein
MRCAGILATCLLMTALLVNEVQGGIRMYSGFRYLRRARESLLAANVDSPKVVVKGAAKGLHPKLRYIRRGVVILKKYRLSCFRDAPPAQQKPGE